MKELPNNCNLPPEQITKLKSLLHDQLRVPEEAITGDLWYIAQVLYTSGLNEGFLDAQVTAAKLPVEMSEAKPKAKVDPYLLKPNQKIEGNSKVTSFPDGWGLREWVDHPEKYHYKEEETK